jgi:hypothetical protein
MTVTDETPTPEQIAAGERAMAGLEGQADIWAEEIRQEPTEAMWGGLARDLVMWDRGMPNQYGSTLYKHLRSSGRDIPAWLLAEIPDIDHTPPKGTVAACIYKAMIAAAPSAPSTPGEVGE